jgi:DNA-binding transcriptional ArsR family regulator
MSDETDRASAAALNPLEFLVFSGSYEEVLRRTAGGYADSDAPAVIGALALSGRLDEAEGAFAAYRSRTRDERASEARFFMVAGLCHAGSNQRALRHATGSLRQVFSADARERFWACQGLALVLCFDGRFRRARRFARRALSAAISAAFPYARFLALDLLAHVSVHLGEIYAGLRLLEQAESLAHGLGYADNAATERTAAQIFQLRFALGDVTAVTAEVERLASAAAVSYFTRRSAWIELAGAFALRGEAARAEAALETARSISLPGADQRGKTRWLLAHALATALSRGGEAARASLEQARAQSGDQLTLRTEIAFVDLVLLGERRSERLAEYRALATQSGSQRVSLACAIAAGEAALHPARVEDALGRLLVECMAEAPLERVRRVVAAGFPGLVCWALERAPARRIVITAAQLISERQGTVVAHPAPNRPAQKLLLAIRHGFKSRAQLLQEVWGVARFVPSRHNAVLHTAVSRLRGALVDPDWVITLDDGYALAEGVEIVGAESLDDAAWSASAPPPPDDRQRVLDFAAAHAEVSSREVARALDISESTALRLLKRLSDEGLLERRGGGRATRYATRGG